MSGTATKQRMKHTKKLSEAVAEDKERMKVENRNGIDKRATLVSVGKAADGTTEDPTSDLVAAPGTPTEEQVAQINEFTRSPKTAEELFVLPTLSCNDQPDRDDDQFSTKCIKEFAELPQPFSFVGKSYMMDHNYSVNNAMGRIFNESTAKKAGVQWLMHTSYIPRTPDNASYIEKVDFGVAWAVSVGVVLGKTSCTVCEAPFGYYWCANGHDKGLYYEPDGEETDSWGYPAPCSPETPGAVKCIRTFDEPQDGYELSSVFLGAQYGAQMAKDPHLKALVKAASVKGAFPIIGASAKEVEKLPIPHEPEAVSEARKQFEIKMDDDGSYSWTDSDGFIWNFDPTEDKEPSTIGRTEDHNNDNKKGASDGADEDAEGLRGTKGLGEGKSSEGDDEGDEEVPSDAEDGGKDGSGSKAVDDDEDESEDDEEDESEDDEDDQDEEDDDTESEKSVKTPKKSTKTMGTVLTATAAKADLKLPTELIEQIEKMGDEDGALDALLAGVAKIVKGLEGEVSELTPKAAVGTKFIDNLKVEVRAAYVKSQYKPGQKKGVKTKLVDKLIAAAGDDVELLKELGDQYDADFRAKFPQAVRRSSFEQDHGEEALHEAGVDEDGDSISKKSDEKVRRLHG